MTEVSVLDNLPIYKILMTLPWLVLNKGCMSVSHGIKAKRHGGTVFIACLVGLKYFICCVERFKELNSEKIKLTCLG